MNPEATNNWRNAILDLTSTVKDAIRVINDTGLKIAMIIDDELKFVGIVSDGDIRRGLLKGIKMEGSVSRILQKN